MKKIDLITTEIILFVGLSFLVNPFLSLVFFFHLLCYKEKFQNKILINCFIILLAVFMAFINSTKVPDNDLYFHGMDYLNAKNLNLYDYLSLKNKEPFFYIFNYYFYNLTTGSFKLWVITITFVPYYLFFTAIKLFFYKIKAPKNQLLLGIILAAFFPQLFSLSAHLIRQFIAAAIFIYFAVNLIMYNKNKWWLVLAAVMIHYSSLILFCLMIYRSVIKKIKQKKTLNVLIIFVLLFYQEISKFLLSIFGNLNEPITRILTRASQDTSFELGNFPWFNFVMMSLMIIIALTDKKTLSKQYYSKLLDKENINSEYSSFFFTMILLSLFILFNLQQSELSIRLFFYLFFYFPFIAPLFVGRFKNQSLLCYITSIFFIIFFIFRLNNGIWEYAPLLELATNSTFSFLFEPELLTN